ncbi:MAG: hypothetical protein LBU85_08480 [Treponema sp.]|jgi:hypothetical protein|nr:hypothetical protein [Treponema sp.]
MNTIVIEDTIFIAGMRMRVIRDTLRLTPPPDLFLDKCLDDLCFINHILVSLSRMINENNGNGFVDYLLDTEWQFSQLLIEFSVDSSPFSIRAFPDTREKIASLRAECDARRKTLEESFVFAGGLAEPVVSSAELSGLLGSR